MPSCWAVSCRCGIVSSGDAPRPVLRESIASEFENNMLRLYLTTIDKLNRLTRFIITETEVGVSRWINNHPIFFQRDGIGQGGEIFLVIAAGGDNQRRQQDSELHSFS